MAVPHVPPLVNIDVAIPLNVDDGFIVPKFVVKVTGIPLGKYPPARDPRLSYLKSVIMVE